MAYEITLPRLGWDMEEGMLAGWLKADGEWVNAGELLFNVEGDKAVQEIEALDSGFLRILPNCPPLGDKVAVGTLLGFLVPKEEIDGFHFPGTESLTECDCTYLRTWRMNSGTLLTRGPCVSFQ